MPDQPVDFVILAVLLLFGVDGIRRGLILSFFDLAVLALSFVVASIYFAVLGASIVARFDWPTALADLVAFSLILVAGEIVRIVGSAIVQILLRPVFAVAPFFGWVNQFAGVVPGLLRGGAYLALVILAITYLPVAGDLRSALASSALAPRLVAAYGVFGPPIQQLARQLPTPSLPEVLDQSSGPSPSITIPAGVATSPDPDAEAQLLALTNQARTANGLAALAPDALLQSVARAHSAEMFRLGYFDHQSPIAGSPVDRYNRAGVVYNYMGENLAYAPSVAVAQQGLMNSPEHRANILSPHYRRVGIGVARAGLWGLMVTEDFAD